MGTDSVNILAFCSQPSAARPVIAASIEYDFRKEGGEGEKTRAQSMRLFYEQSARWFQWGQGCLSINQARGPLVFDSIVAAAQTAARNLGLSTPADQSNLLTGLRIQANDAIDDLQQHPLPSPPMGALQVLSLLGAVAGIFALYGGITFPAAAFLGLGAGSWIAIGAALLVTGGFGLMFDSSILGKPGKPAYDAALKDRLEITIPASL